MKTTNRDIAIDIAKNAGEIIRKNHGVGMHREWKGDATPLTASDRMINQLVLDETHKYTPEFSVISEEGSRIQQSDYAWVCDPIDGTVPFSHGFPISVFSIALTKNGESILGIIYDPYLDRMAVAEKGRGTFVNGEKVAVSSAKTIQNTVVDVEGWLGPFVEVSSLHTNLIKNHCHATSIRSTCYGAMMVACGEFAAVIGTSPHPWDGAASKIIVEEAGGKVSDLYGNEQVYNTAINGLLISNGALHHKLLQLVKDVIK